MFWMYISHCRLPFHLFFLIFIFILSFFFFFIWFRISHICWQHKQKLVNFQGSLSRNNPFYRQLITVFIQSDVSEFKCCDETPPPPAPVRSCHLDIKDAQRAKKNDGRKVSYQFPKNSTFSKSG